MKHAGVIAAVAVVLAANAAALFHAARNRSGAPDAVIQLTEREAMLLHYNAEENTGNSLWLVYQAAPLHEAPSVSESQLPRRGYVALEYDGAAWENWHAANPATRLDDASRLVPIDAALTGEELRRRHPDRSKVIILPCVLPVGPGGYIRKLLVDHISVPPGFRDVFSAASSPSARPRYVVTLATGRYYEPYVTEVRLTVGQVASPASHLFAHETGRPNGLPH